MTEPVFPVATYRRIKLRLIHAHADSEIDDVITCLEEVLLLCPSGISATIVAHLPTKTIVCDEMTFAPGIGSSISRYKCLQIRVTIKGLCTL